MNMLILIYGNNVTETNLITTVDSVLPIKPNLEDFLSIETKGIKDKVD